MIRRLEGMNGMRGFAPISSSMGNVSRAPQEARAVGVSSEVRDVLDVTERRGLDSAVDDLIDANRELQRAFRELDKAVDELSDDLSDLRGYTQSIRWELSQGYHPVPGPWPWLVSGGRRPHWGEMPEDTAYAVAADINVSKAQEAMKDLKRIVKDAERHVDDFDMYVSDVEYYARKGDRERAYDASRDAYRAASRVDDVRDVEEQVEEIRNRLRKVRYQLAYLYDYLPAGWTLPPADMEELIELALGRTRDAQNALKRLEDALEGLERAVSEARRAVRDVQRELTRSERAK